MKYKKYKRKYIPRSWKAWKSFFKNPKLYYRTAWLEYELADILAEEIQKEIDTQLIDTLKGIMKK